MCSVRSLWILLSFWVLFCLCFRVCCYMVLLTLAFMITFGGVNVACFLLMVLMVRVSLGLRLNYVLSYLTNALWFSFC